MTAPTPAPAGCHAAVDAAGDVHVGEPTPTPNLIVLFFFLKLEKKITRV